MWVLLIYVGLMVAFDFVDYLVGSAVSRYWSDAVSLPVFLFSYFFTLWLAWVIAVRIAERMKLTT